LKSSSAAIINAVSNLPKKSCGAMTAPNIHGVGAQKWSANL
jgi:hypothetical protein